MNATDHPGGFVVDVFSSPDHTFSKDRQTGITLWQGLGVQGDAHCGVTVKHRFDAKKDPTRPNLRQVHLLQSELLDEVQRKGFTVRAG
ncbi:MAG: MOSC domain-containing protein, partial [Variibacter sp.]|nr:MOSC domain-containing protein [Variibacter sp.]